MRTTVGWLADRALRVHDALADVRTGDLGLCRDVAAREREHHREPSVHRREGNRSQWQREPVGVKQLSRTPETPNVESPTLVRTVSMICRHEAR